MNFQRVCDLFPVDLGVDLRALQPEITQCKRRFQQDLWNTICNRVLQKDEGWKKDGSKEGSKEGSKTKSEEKAEKTEEEGGETKEEEPPKEEEENKPEESGENENNAGNWSNSGVGGGGGGGGRPRESRQRAPPQQQPMRRGGPPVSGRRGNSAQGYPRAAAAMQAQQMRFLPLEAPPAPLQRPRPQQQQQQQRQQKQQQQQWQWQQHQQQQQQHQLQHQRRMASGGDAGGGGGELSQFLCRIRPQEGVLDWRDSGRPRLQPSATDAASGFSRPRALQQQQQQQQHQQSLLTAAHAGNSNHARSYSATSRREILGGRHEESLGLMDDEAVDASEAFEGAQMFYSGCGGYCERDGLNSDADTSTYRMNATSNLSGQLDGASASSAASREFVPLVVGNWWGGRHQQRQQQQQQQHGGGQL